MSRRIERRCMTAALTLGLAFGGFGMPALAADPQVPAKAPQPEQILEAMSSHLAQAKAFTYHAEIEFDQILPGGPKIRLSGAVDVAVARPGKLAVDYRDDVSQRLVWFDDGTVTVFDGVEGTFAKVSGPSDIDGMVAHLEKEFGLTLPLAEFAESDPHAVLSRGVEFAHYVGVHDVEGVMCHHVVLQRPDLDVQVFVEVGDTPLPRKVVFDYPNREGAPQYTASITEWNFEAPKPEVFVAKVPEGAAEVEFLAVEGQ